ncbi:Voltage-gated potassium channel Kch [Prosthecochloris sp. CIB 2401]|uniref:Potassium channel protein n=2 Tax=Chlorobiaceae TaxID=191412 RepID=A0A5C4RZI6_PROVB|nr:Voltage-gated potassium channel Kch [Prosthecochloris sp. CIB 2401]TNJ36540.1 potassium channel protein [Prosthecochloris vibrioformis]
MLIWVGTTGYIMLEHMTLIDALYMTIITLSTVGFSEIHTLSETGRLFTLALIIGGTSLFFYTLTNVAVFFLSGEWREHLELQRYRRMLLVLDNHYIICGFGRLGSSVAAEMSAKGIPFVIIETSQEKIDATSEQDYITINGNAADETMLREAGIDRAKGLIAATNSDAENVFIVLTARTLRAGLHIVARADCEESRTKLMRAGADKVVLLYKSAGRKMANLLIDPGLEEYLEELNDARNTDLQMAQFTISAKSSLVGKSFREADLYNKLMVSPVGYKLPGGEMHSSPRPAEVIQQQGTIIAIGKPSDLDNLKKLARGDNAL